jgi:hypothetical protein
VRESLVALWNLSRRFLVLAINLSKLTALRGVNALVRCKEGQVFAVRTVTLVRDGFSTNFSTFLLKSFDCGGCRLPNGSRMTDSFTDRKKKTFPIRHLAVNHFRGAFFDAAAVRMLE